MKIRYLGPFDAVEIPTLGVTCEKGQEIEVDDEVGKNLGEQSSWEEASAKKGRDR